ncbi:MAG: hypothetical protein WBD91_10360, partial [Acidobacteriaceae bacterium]
VDISISSLIDLYSERIRKRPEGSFETKLASLSSIVQFYLGIVAASHVSPRNPADLSKYRSSIILIGYDEAKDLKFAKVLISPGLGGEFHSTIGDVTQVGDGFVHLTSGMWDVAEGVLANPDGFLQFPEISQYEQLRSRGDESAMSLAEMSNLASRLAQLTSAEYPALVGGADQTATFTNGHLTIHQPQRNPKSSPIYDVDLVEYDFGPVSAFNAIFDPSKAVVLNVNDNFTGGEKVIDGQYYIHDIFQDVILTFDGGDTYFDPQNKLVRSALIVGPHVVAGDPTLCGLEKLNWERIEFASKETELASKRPHHCGVGLN